MNEYRREREEFNLQYLSDKIRLRPPETSQQQTGTHVGNPH